LILHHGGSGGSIHKRLLHKFLIQTSDKIEQNGQGKFIPARLANVIRTETMKNIICANNQVLQNIVSIPINGFSKVALNTEITLDDADEETDQR